MGQSQTGQSLPLIFVLAQASIVVANVMAKEPRTPVSSTAPSPTQYHSTRHSNGRNILFEDVHCENGTTTSYTLSG